MIIGLELGLQYGGYEYAMGLALGRPGKFAEDHMASMAIKWIWRIDLWFLVLGIFKIRALGVELVASRDSAEAQALALQKKCSAVAKQLKALSGIALSKDPALAFSLMNCVAVLETDLIGADVLGHHKVQAAASYTREDEDFRD